MTTTRYVTKRAIREFEEADRKLSEWAWDRGAEVEQATFPNRLGLTGHRCRIETKAGWLRFGLMPGYGCGHWIAARFDSPGKARRVVDCNPHSGKWNKCGTSATESLAMFLTAVGPLMEEPCNR